MPDTSGMLPDERDRLTRLETKVDYIIAHMDSLPASPETLRKLDNLLEKTQSHDTFIEGLKLKIGIVGAGFMLFGTAFTYLFKWVLTNLNINWGN